MPLRTSVRIACRRCRKKRAKCDGQTPCARCEEAGDECEYDVVPRESKGELRAETARLRKKSAESGALVRAIASIQDPHLCKMTLQGLVDGSVSRDDILREYRDRTGSDSSSGPTSSAGPLSSPYLSISQQSTLLPSACCPEEPPPCFDQLLTWLACHPNPSVADVDNGTPPPPLSLSLPALPLDAYTHQPHKVDTWTCTGWTHAHVRHLIDALHTWDYLPLCVFCEDLFLRDYDDGTPRFCSAALVHAILALATRLINESSDDAALLPSGGLSSQVLFDGARANLSEDFSQVVDLPDIQALGILSLYRLRCGFEAEARELAEAFAARTAEHCQRPLPDDEPAREDFSKSRLITYCGAVSLVRMLSLVTGRLFNSDEPTISEDLFSLDQLAGSASIAGQRSEGLRPNLATPLTPWNAQLVAANLFQLTEWVYNVILSAEVNIQAGSREVIEVYERCLHWYKDFFDILVPEGGRTPFVLFVHMYYHFCLLCAFRPFVSLTLDNADVGPQEICTQAVQSILALAQSYDDLFTLRRVSGFIPYFICASGLFSLAMEDGGSQVRPLRLRRADGESMNGDIGEGEDDKPQGNAAPGATMTVETSHIKISPPAHACALLARIGSTHLAAMTADRLLRKEITSRFKQRQEDEGDDGCVKWRSTAAVPFSPYGECIRAGRGRSSKLPRS